jgi:hypothetical protein
VDRDESLGSILFALARDELKRERPMIRGCI